MTMENDPVLEKLTESQFKRYQSLKRIPASAIIPVQPLQAQRRKVRELVKLLRKLNNTEETKKE